MHDYQSCWQSGGDVIESVQKATIDTTADASSA